VLPERYVVSGYEQSDWLSSNEWSSNWSASWFRLLSFYVLAPNFSLDEFLSHRSLGDAPGSRQLPFSVGISIAGPICPVMIFCCLSTDSFRFLILPVPTGEFCLPCGRPTQGIDHP